MSHKVIVAPQSSSVGVGHDRTPFWSAAGSNVAAGSSTKLSTELRFVQQVLAGKVPQFVPSQKCYREILKMLSSNVPEQRIHEKLRSVSDQQQVSMHHLCVFYASLAKMWRLAVRQPSPSSQKQHEAAIRDDLVDVLKVPTEFATDFVTALFSQKDVIECISSVQHNGPRYPTLKNVKWRVDVSISTSSLSRTMEPSVYMELTLATPPSPSNDSSSCGDEQKVSFEMTLASFHKLRFSVAQVLKEFEDLLNRPMFKLIDSGGGGGGISASQ